MEEINCPNCNQRIKIIGTIGYDLYKENLLNKEQEIKRLKEEYVMLQNASDEVEEEKDKEIERIKQGYCELKEKCNKGECDCTHEEYNNMCEENIKMDLEIERLNGIIEIKTNRIQDLMSRLSKRTEKVERLTTILKEVREYINKYLQEHVIDEYPDEQSTFYDEEERFIPNAKTKLLEILDKEKE